MLDAVLRASQSGTFAVLLGPSGPVLRSRWRRWTAWTRGFRAATETIEALGHLPVHELTREPQNEYLPLSLGQFPDGPPDRLELLDSDHDVDRIRHRIGNQGGEGSLAL